MEKSIQQLQKEAQQVAENVATPGTMRYCEVESRAYTLLSIGYSVKAAIETLSDKDNSAHDDLKRENTQNLLENFDK